MCYQYFQEDIIYNIEKYYDLVSAMDNLLSVRIIIELAIRIYVLTIARSICNFYQYIHMIFIQQGSYGV